MKAEPKKVALTKTRVNTLPAPAKGRVYVYDAKTPGLCVAVTSAGTKTFYIYKWVSGRPQRIRIGRHPDVSVEQARHEAQKLTGLMVQGVNPQDAKRAAREEMTFGELFTDYLEVHAKPHKRTWQEDQKMFARYLRPLAGRRLSALTQDDVKRLHGSIGQHHGHYAANRMLALVSTVFNECASNLPNPAKGVHRFEEQSRDRFLDGEELRRFFEALDSEPATPWRDFFLVALGTGARRSNVLAMKWADLNLGRGLWRIEAAESKNRKPMICILAAPVVEILRRRHDENGESVFVFPGTGKTGHLEEPKKVWHALLKRADLLNGDGKNDVRLHDLRRTLGSWAAGGGASLPMIGKILGHRNAASTEAYARLDLDPVRATVEATTARIFAAGNGGRKMLPAGRKPRRQS